MSIEDPNRHLKLMLIDFFSPHLLSILGLRFQLVNHPLALSEAVYDGHGGWLLDSNGVIMRPVAPLNRHIHWSETHPNHMDVFQILALLNLFLGLNPLENNQLFSFEMAIKQNIDRTKIKLWPR